MRQIIKFAGHNSHEALEIGRHTTVRQARPKYIRMEPGEQIAVVDETTGNHAYAVVNETVHSIDLPTIAKLENIEGERTHLTSGARLATALREYYPDSNDDTSFIAIEFTTYLREQL